MAAGPARETGASTSRCIGRPGQDGSCCVPASGTSIRQRPAHPPAAVLPNLASSLNNQSNRLAALGRREDALAAIDEAVTIRRQLADARPDAFLPHLASALNNQSNQLTSMGRASDAASAAAEAAQPGVAPADTGRS